MKAVVAIDSLKGSMSSLEAGDAIREGILRADPSAQVQVRPLADGGEGTVEALTLGIGGAMQTVKVTGPLGDMVQAQYGILNDGRTAIMEMSQAAGITLVSDHEKNPLKATTYGVGEMIIDAIRKGCRHFIFGLGGSVTNDGGIGMLQALGFGLLDGKGNQVPLGAEGLKTPLCGEQGASAVYGPQKGADPTMIMQMDRWLLSYADLAAKTFPTADPDLAGAGAAGGLGFAFMTFTNAVLESGIRIVLEETHLEDYIKDADLVITGEGRLDAQTVMGKAPAGVADIARKYGKPVIAFAGSVTKDARACNEHGIDAFFPILRGVSTLQEAMDPENARQNMIDTVEQVMRLYMINS